jgi:Tfp pilus assembly protein PilN
MALTRKQPQEASAQNEAIQAWHPNFRNVAHLPDVKVVRTSFFINGIAGFLAAAMLLYAAHQHLTIKSLGDQMADWEQRIADNKPASDRAIATYKNFQAAEKKLGEVKTFAGGDWVVSDFLVKLAETLPGELVLTRFEYRGTELVLSALVNGESPQASSGAANAFADQLRSSTEFSVIFSDIQLTNMSRIIDSSSLNVIYVLKFKPPPAPAAAKK